MDIPHEGSVSRLGRSTLRTLLYFDIFSYPLTLPEIQKFSSINILTLNELQQELHELEKTGLIFKFGYFYCLKDDEAMVARRVKGNKEAEKYLPMAQQRATFISRFPFVRGVMASGSLSKGYMDEKSDLDFFVITEPRRLWIARTLFVMYRKFFIPRRRHKEFCANYFIAADQLDIEEKNIFTATELATLIPLCNQEMYFHLLEANGWMRDFLPNFRAKESEGLGAPTDFWLKNVLEKIARLFFPTQVNALIMQATLLHLKRKYQKLFDASEFSLALKTQPHVSKVHLGNNQKRVLTHLQEKIKEFETKLSRSLTHA